ncbi:ribosomal methyltransferase [bacterium]|nr:MAG: ribosomal methyltransferase [bacterium]
MSDPTILLPSPSSDLVAGLVRLEQAIDRARPLRGKHRATLPREVATLSEMLTYERDSLPPDYMSRPAHLSAYLRWFLPWNIYRQGRLLAGLPLDLPAEPRLLDVGAGPLTFACALWLARPELRDRPLQILAVDRSEAALKAGRQVLTELAGGKLPWRIELQGRAAGGRMGPPCDLLVAANLLNELGGERASRRRRGPDQQGDERLLEAWQKQLAPDGRILLVERGVRTAAARLVRLRAAALEHDWQVVAPCPHGEACPLPGKRSGSWCHFACDTAGMPAWVERIGRSAQLPTERVSLSFLLLGRGETAAADPDVVRVVSDNFALDGGGRGRYGCTADGLVVLTGRGPVVSGELVRVKRPDRTTRDPRSGAMLLPLPVGGGGRRRR